MVWVSVIPSSLFTQSIYIFDVVLRKHTGGFPIRSILDVGVGWGKYGLLMREYLSQLDIMLDRENWKLRVDGIEIYPNYIKKHTENIYDDIFLTDIRDFSKNPKIWTDNPRWDLILMVDIIEHLSKEEGMEVLNNLLPYAKWILITTPLEMEKQPIEFYHEHEEHVSVWHRGDFYPFKIDKMLKMEKFLLCMIRGNLGGVD